MPPSQSRLEVFVDRSLGRHLVPQALRDAGLIVHTMAEVFGEREQQVTDAEWLQHAGQRGWIVLTKDKRIRQRHVEVEALESHGVKAFVLMSGSLTGPQQAERFIGNLDRIRAAVERPGPFVFAVQERRIVRLERRPQAR